MKLVDGTATLKFDQLFRFAKVSTEQVTAIVGALWCAHPAIVAVSVSHERTILVEVAIPEDGSIDFAKLHRHLEQKIHDALTK